MLSREEYRAQQERRHRLYMQQQRLNQHRPQQSRPTPQGPQGPRPPYGNGYNHGSRFSQPQPNVKFHHRKPWLVFLSLLVLFYLVIGIDSAIRFRKTSYDFNNASLTAAARMLHHQPINVLMMGTDTGALGRHARGRTDTMMLNTINAQKQTMALTSIPRDAPARYNGYLTKINAVYTLGGANQTEKYVQSYLHVPVNYYMLINMGGLDKIIDKVGGVTVKPPLSFHYGAAHVKKNQTVKLNGMQALDYCRMRHQDPLGDYGRQIRQRQVLFQLFNKVTQIHNLFLHPFLPLSLCDNIKTNLSVTDFIQLMLFYRHANRHHVSTHLQGHTKQIDGQDYEVISPEEKAAKSEQITKEMEA